MSFSKYKNIIVFSSEKPFYKTNKAPFSKNFNFNNYVKNIEDKRDFDQNIKELILKRKSNIDLLLILRCKVSDSIKNTIDYIHNWGKANKEDWDKLDLLRLFLDDNGEREILREKRNLPTAFDYSYIEEIYNNNKKINELIYPFSGEVIYSFDHLNKANISTWTNRRVITDNRLKKFFINYRYRNFGDFALLYATPISTIIKACKSFGNFKNFKLIEELILSYKDIYPKNNKKGWIPDAKFLKRLNPPQKDDKLLLKIANCVRKYFLIKFQKEEKDLNNIVRKDNNIFMNNLPNVQEDKKYEDTYYQSGFEKVILKTIHNKAKELIKLRILNDIKKSTKKPERLKAWIIFSEIDLESSYKNKEFENIASKCGHDSAWLTKLFSFPEVTRITTKYELNKLHDMTVESVTKPKLFIKKYEGNNKLNLYKKDMEDFRKFYIGIDNKRWGGDEHKTIFKEEKYIKKYSLYFNEYINPKKSRKVFFIKIVKEILRELNHLK